MLQGCAMIAVGIRARILELKRWLGATQLIYVPAARQHWHEEVADEEALLAWASGAFDRVLWVGDSPPAVQWAEPWIPEALEHCEELPRVVAPSVVCLEASPKLLGVLEHFRHARLPVALLVQRAESVMSPPPEPEALEEWPTLTEVSDALRFGENERYLAIWRDVFFSVPSAQALSFASSLQHEAGRANGTRSELRAESLLRDARAATRSLATLGRTLLTRGRER